MSNFDPTSRARPAGDAHAHWPARRTWRTRLWRLLWRWRDKGTRYALQRVVRRFGHLTRSYENWIKANDTLSPQDVAQIRSRIQRLGGRPLIGLVLLTEEPTAAALRGALDSVRDQLYENWQVYVAGRGIAAADIAALLNDYASADARIKIANEAPDMTAAANGALAATAGDFVGLLSQDDRLAPHALYMIAEEINSCPDATLIYTDEDLIDEQGKRHAPHFKSDWNPDLFLSQNYIGRLAVYRRDHIASIGFRAEFDGCRDYDLTLRLIERVAPRTIRHVPYLLVHRKSPAGGAMPGWRDMQSARRALQAHLGRAGIGADVETSRSGKYLRVRRRLPESPPRVSIVIPFRDRVELLRDAVESILGKTEYPNYEIVLVDNQSADAATLSYLASLTERPEIRILKYDHKFNYSAINNFAAAQCQSPVLAFLNNDILVINGEWLAEMVSQAIRPDVGAVGAMLYYPDDAVQHAGIIVGFGGVAANCGAGIRRGSAGYFHRAELQQNYSAVTAACLLTRAEVFAGLNGFNERDLPVAFNDVDYCLRLRERGFLVTWTPYAELYHLESVSRGDDMSPSQIERFLRDQAYMAGRWAPVLANDPYYNPNLSLDEVPYALAAAPRVRRPWKPDKAAPPSAG